MKNNGKIKKNSSTLQFEKVETVENQNKDG